MNYRKIIAKLKLGLPLTKRENAVYELFIKGVAIGEGGK